MELDGLVHISQLREERVEKIKDVLKQGRSIKAANCSEEDMRKEAAAFDTAIKPGEDLVALDKAFASAFEDYRPGQK